MTLGRVTQNMIANRSYTSMQNAAARLARSQEQLTTGRILNRPSDNPADATSAMRLRSSRIDQSQYLRNSEDGLGWLGQIDSTLQSALKQIDEAREAGLQGVNAVNQSPQAREALAARVDQLRESLIGVANTTYVGRPVFGGLTAGLSAYDPDGNYIGQPGPVERTISPGIRIQVNVDGATAFGPPGAGLFSNLAALSAALRADDSPGVRNALTVLGADHSRITSVLSDVGSKVSRLERAAQAAKDASLSLMSSLSELENVDLAEASMELKLNEVAYQAALAATARVVQPSLSDFLR